MAKQEAAPRRLSSESTAPVPQRGTRRATTSRLRRRRVLFPRNTPTPSERTTPARSRGTYWASPSYLRRRCSPPLARLCHRLSTKRYRPIPISCLLDSASTHQATSLRWKPQKRHVPTLRGTIMRSPWDRPTAVSTYGPSGSKEDDEPDLCWDFSGLGNPSAMRDFMTACDYCLSDCSDGSRSFGDEDCGPSRECFHVDLGGPGEGNHLGIPENGDPRRPAPRVDILQELVVVPVPAGGQDSQLEQIRGAGQARRGSRNT
jgi:hypothetical protein